MPLDPTNAPFQRGATYREDDAAAFLGAPPSQGFGRMQMPMPTVKTSDGPRPVPRDDIDLTLKAENILLEEFNYASVTAYQAKAESGALFNLYLLAVGALATGIGVLVNSYSFSSRLTFTLVETAVLAISGVLSFAFFVRHLDLVREYAESLATMDSVKEFYIQRLRPRMPEIERTFTRRHSAQVYRDSLGRGATVMRMTVALMGSFAIAGAIGSGRQLWAIATNHSAPYAVELRLWGIGLPYFWEILAALLALLAHLLYQRLLSGPRQPQKPRIRRSQLSPK